MKIEVDTDTIKFLLHYIEVQSIYISDDYSVEMDDDNPGLEAEYDKVIEELKATTGITV